MSHPINVGSVLGGRYKVTATVLASHDQDLVLDGVDQVLNRAVSILVAGPGNADQVAQSAREVATGERPGNVQILDLGVTDAGTYLITNHTSAPDLLDLVVSSNPPYVEPFFTDTLGSEIFGQARSNEPETYDGLYDDEEVDAGYIDYGRNQSAGARPQPPAGPAGNPPNVPSRPAGAPATGAAAAAAARAPSAKPAPRDATQHAAPSAPQQSTAPQPVQNSADRPQRPAPEAPPAAEKPKVSLWSDTDYAGSDAGGSKDRGSGAAAAAAPASADRAPGKFPASARAAGVPAAGADDPDDVYYDDEPEREPRSMRWLVGGLLAAVLVVGLVFAVGNLGSLFRGSPASEAGAGAGSPTAAASSPAASPTTSSSPTASDGPVAGPPAIEGVTRLGSFEFAGTYDGDLVKTFDGNGASYWSDMEFATDNWGGLAEEVPLVVKLEKPSQVSSVTLSQLGASGGNINVFTNDKPSLAGAKQVGSNSFTSPDLTIALQEPVTAQYVIVSIEKLPKLAAPKTRFGFGLRLAEIKVQ